MIPISQNSSYPMLLIRRHSAETWLPEMTFISAVIHTVRNSSKLRVSRLIFWMDAAGSCFEQDVLTFVWRHYQLSPISEPHDHSERLAFNSTVAIIVAIQSTSSPSSSSSSARSRMSSIANRRNSGSNSSSSRNLKHTPMIAMIISIILLSV